MFHPGGERGGDVGSEERNTWKHLLDSKEADRDKKAVCGEIWKTGRKELELSSGVSQPWVQVQTD